MDDWSLVYSISQILIILLSALSSVDPRPAKIPGKGSYLEEVVDACVRVATTHSWQVPQGRQTLFNQQGSK